MLYYLIQKYRISLYSKKERASILDIMRASHYSQFGNQRMTSRIGGLSNCDIKKNVASNACHIEQY